MVLDVSQRFVCSFNCNMLLLFSVCLFLVFLEDLNLRNLEVRNK